jgi:NADPH-dependent glutamate synthase beta subunit-like oxidoreductase/Pyruvate/2-oxoacid:ferredoxin oxidoreductase delta subunit
MSNGALIIGGSVTGLQAALDLADSGVSVHLVERSPFLDNLATEDTPLHLLNARALEIIRHPNITVWNNTTISQFAPDGNNLQVEILQKPRCIDISRCTACGECIEVCPVTVMEQGGAGCERKAIYLGGQPGCAAIDKPGKAPCASTCPGGIHVQGYVALIAQKRYAEAVALIRKAIPFPSVCGRVCNHYCEANCTRGKVDASVNIMALKRFVADWAYENRADIPKSQEEKPEPTNYKIAIIGAGPSGLTASRDLVRLGHAVTVFDALPTAGGMMRVGIPPHRLPTKLLDWEIQQIIDEGVELRLNTWVDDIPGLLEDGYDSVLIATGAHRAKKLPLRNSNHPDNWLSLDLLRRTCLGKKIDLSGKDVVILGGGNVALDTARTVIRLGADKVRMVCLEPRGEMPGFEWEVAVAEEEGVEFFTGQTFKEIVLENDEIVGVHCAEVNFHGMVKGRPSFDEIPDTEHIIPASLVIWAIGQEPDFSFLPHDGSIDTRFPVGIRSDENMMTTMPGVFVSGDVHRGMTFFVIDAIGEGHKAARSIDRYLRGDQGLQEPGEFSRIEYTTDESVSRYKASNASRRMRAQIPSIPIKERIGNFREVDMTLSEEEALTEANRCLQCGTCSECLSCVDACRVGAIHHDQGDIKSWLNVGAIIIAENADHRELLHGKRIYRAPPNDALQGSATAAQILSDLPFQRQSVRISAAPTIKTTSGRIGVFICNCGDAIAEIIDTDAILEQVSRWPDVIHAQILSNSCSSDAAEIIQTAVEAYALDRVVLAACSCCNIDQVCFSCTYQRVRCKDNLGLFAPIDTNQGISRKAARFARFEFVNIREQCAWVHQDDPQAGTDKAKTLIASTVGRARAAPGALAGSRSIERSTLILGKGPAASICENTFRRQGIDVQRVVRIPHKIQRSGGLFLVNGEGQTWSASTLLLAPENESESRDLITAFGRKRRQPQIHTAWGGLETHRPGVFYIGHKQNPEIAGVAVTARVNAWIGRSENRPPTAAVVDPERCRACKTCIDTCEYCAPELVEIDGRYASWIDPAICTSCGTCAAHCPSGAITAGCSTDTQLEAMMDEIFNWNLSTE